jgi:hypothetical protein
MDVYAYTAASNADCLFNRHLAVLRAAGARCKKRKQEDVMTVNIAIDGPAARENHVSLARPAKEHATFMWIPARTTEPWALTLCENMRQRCPRLFR